MFTRSISALGAVAMAASTLFLATPAAAAPAGEDAIAISYAGLDMSNPADAARFDRRLRAAAEDYCGQVPGTDTRLFSKVRACRSAVVDNAKAELSLALAGKGHGTAIALNAN
jgi:UrcA family protein